MRPSDLFDSIANPSKAKKILGWEAKVKLNEIIINMINSKLIDNYYG